VERGGWRGRNVVERRVEEVGGGERRVKGGRWWEGGGGRRVEGGGWRVNPTTTITVVSRNDIWVAMW